MIIRIVKMTFRPEEVERFKGLMRQNSKRIRAFDGCLYLRLLQGADSPNVFFTYSYWRSEADLEKYRRSELFAEIWPQARSAFKDRAEAWTVDSFIELDENI